MCPFLLWLGATTAGWGLPEVAALGTERARGGLWVGARGLRRSRSPLSFLPGPVPAHPSRREGPGAGNEHNEPVCQRSAGRRAREALESDSTSRGHSAFPRWGHGWGWRPEPTVFASRSPHTPPQPLQIQRNFQEGSKGICRSQHRRSKGIFLTLLREFSSLSCPLLPAGLGLLSCPGLVVWL